MVVLRVGYSPSQFSPHMIAIEQQDVTRISLFYKLLLRYGIKLPGLLVKDIRW